jgi:cellulose biosynthesis protein BcsQ
MKQVNLILQSKGGVGKSLLTWFLANHYSDENVLFMDVDESTRTSSSRLASILSSLREVCFILYSMSKRN